MEFVLADETQQQIKDFSLETHNEKRFRYCTDLSVLDSFLHFSYVRETGIFINISHIMWDDEQYKCDVAILHS
ncbi:hypothetical protein YC2023_078013 [Brassica napus]